MRSKKHMPRAKTSRSSAEENLRYRERFEKMVADISATLINLPDSEIDSWINSALQLIGEFEGVDRSYIFKFNPEGSIMDNTHEWCARGVEPQIHNLKGVPTEAFPWWMMKLRANEEVNIPDVAGLPPEAKAEREILEPQSILSLLVVPLNIEGRVEGFVGFDSVRARRDWNTDSVSLVRLAASIIGGALARKEAEEVRREHERILWDVAGSLTRRGPDYLDNVRELTALAGWLLRGDAAVYHRFQDGKLAAAGKWKVPEGFREIDDPAGYLGHELAGGSGEDPLLVPDLAASRFAGSDPLAALGGYKSYSGCRVKGEDGKPLGALSVFFLQPRTLSRVQVAALVLLAQALGSEEVRREATEKLQESEARWQYALEGASDGVWDWDVPSGRIFFSWRWKEMLGYGGREIGSGLEEWSSRVHPDDLAGTMEKVKAHIEGRTESYFSEHRMRCKNGSYKWVLDRGKIILRSPDGKPLRFIGTHADIDALKRVEQENLESLAKLTTLIDNMQAGLLLESPERKVMFANKQFCSMFSVPVPPEALSGADCAAAAQQSKELMKDPDAFMAAITAAVAGGLPAEREVALKDGRCYRQAYLPIRQQDGRLVGHMWKYNDVTSEKELARMRSEVAHHVNHELRRPITNQVLALEILKDDLEGKLAPDQALMLDSAISAAKNMTRMVEDLVEVTRSETGKLSVQAERLDLPALVRDLAAGLERPAQAAGITLATEAEAGLPPVFADPARVRQIVGNLVDNAFKFTRSPGRITVALRRSATYPGFAEVSVADTGQGIDAADLPRLFDRLYQTANISRKGMKGLGLGLHICKTLVERQGGSIAVESEKGKGTVFRFTLPLYK